MSFQKYQDLGRRIDDAWHRVHRDEKQFPEVACEALAEFQPGAFDLQDIGRFLLTTSIPQQPETRFSNLPVMLYRGEGFYIELLVWTRSTTSIHQHAFSGAFRLMHGSSLLSEYRFVEQQRINSHVLFGEVQMHGMRLLRVGDVLPIVSGRQGTIHALFHLDEPSATLVARTYRDPDAGPQYTFHAPRFAIDPFWADADERLAIIGRWFGTVKDICDGVVPETMLEQVAGGDLARALTFALNRSELLADVEVRERFLNTLRPSHKCLADALSEGVQIELRQRSLIATRKLIKDSDLRFFIALLMNANSRAQIMEMVSARWPGSDLEARCVEWLLRLGDPERTGVALRDRSPLLVRLGIALSTAGVAAPDVVAAIIGGRSLDEQLSGTHADVDLRQRMAQSDRALRSTPELAVLLRRS